MGSKKSIIVGEDDKARCFWCGAHEDYQHYHDTEWGRPVVDEARLFEKICLEGFQAGLSWLTILRKRENFRSAFADFEVDKVARFNQRSVTRLLGDAGIVRHRGKIEATLNNAKRAREMRDAHGSLAAFFWRFEPQVEARPRRMTRAALMKLSKTPESTALSKELRGLGWAFVGPTTCYAFMQAMGMVNDHLEDCWLRAEIEAKRQRFRRPS